MKKLMIVAAAVLAGIASNAANVKWGSGSVQSPDATGALSGNKLTTDDGYTLKMYAWESLTAADLAFASGDLYKWYAAGAKGSAFDKATTINGAVNMGSSATTATATGTLTPATEGDPVYGAVLFVLEDGDGKAKWYMENAGEKATAKSTQTLNFLATKVGGTGDVTTWTAAAVPEPTSGLLLLLGVAGLALRRRRA